MYLTKDKDISVHKQLVGATATGNGTAVDTQTSDGKAQQVILVVSGTGAQTVKLEHSTDNSTFADITGASVTITANGVGMVIATNTRRYVRANATTVAATTVVDATLLLTGYDNIT